MSSSDDEQSTREDGADGGGDSRGGAERWWRLALEAWSDRRLAVAETAITRYRRDMPQSGTARLLHAEILTDLRRFGAAQTELEALGVPAEGSAELPVVVAWARLCEARGALEEAVEWHLRATELEPRITARWTRLGEALARLGRLTEAEAIHRHATVLDDEPAAGWLALGRVLRDQGRLDDALQAVLDGEAVSDDDPELRALRADLEQALRLSS